MPDPLPRSSTGRERRHSRQGPFSGILIGLVDVGCGMSGDRGAGDRATFAGCTGATGYPPHANGMDAVGCDRHGRWPGPPGVGG